MVLRGEIVEASSISDENKREMFLLMDEFYDNMTYPAFLKDLGEKDYCILLYDEVGTIKGFSTQKIMNIKAGKKYVYGIFSGDTIIHSDYWGSLELYKIFTKFFVNYGERYEDFYWFLISKGYKTYKMLPLFFKCFYPNYKVETPEFEQALMKSFGREKYPEEYNEQTGVVHYKSEKDRLKDGVADITAKKLKDRNIEFFIKSNPDYVRGNDLVCLARLSRDNLSSTARRLFLGEVM